MRTLGIGQTDQVMTRAVLDVALDPKTAGRRALWTYADNGDAALGDAVLVPIGKRQALGFVVRRYAATEDELGFRFDELKSILEVVTGIRIPEVLIDLAKFVAETYLFSLPVALSPCIPPGVRDRLEGAWTLGEPAEGVSVVQQEVIRKLQEAGGELSDEEVRVLPEGIVRAFKALRTSGNVRFVQRLAPFTERRQKEKLVRLCADEAAIERFLRTEGKRKPAQALTLMRLQAAGGPPLSPLEVRALAGVTETTVRALVQDGLLEWVKSDEVRLAVPPTPNPAQQLAVDAISEAISGRESSAFLLFGVTGSGKTEVYLRAAAQALSLGRQVLYLVPEIALATQAISQMRSRFGRGVAVLHSELTQLERLRTWIRIANGEASVVLGPRSAIFAPLPNLGLIVMDEEHESAYKQEQSPRYHARTVARELARLHQCPIVLGSATPSLETFYEAENGGVTLISLPSRAASAQMPTVQICDLAAGYRDGKPALLVPELATAISEALERKEQAILFLNRRAYAPFLMCRDCGYRTACPQCSVALSYHRGERKLRCHQCGHSVVVPSECPKCTSTRLNPFGLGTEKVEEGLRELFPAAQIGRLDRDIASRKGALEEVLSAFRAGDLDLLVGTQMVAKGLDFPNVTVVGVVAADISLSVPDFRSGERTFQLLSQVAGRAGRGSLPGRVFVQTFNPEHPAVVHAQGHDYVGFFEGAILERQSVGYPPFVRLVNVLVTGPDRDAVGRASGLLRDALPLGLTVLGPADCPLERLNNRWRRHLLLKLSLDADLAEVQAAVESVSVRGVSVVIDVDPVSLS